MGIILSVFIKVLKPHLVMIDSLLLQQSDIEEILSVFFC